MDDEKMRRKKAKHIAEKFKLQQGKLESINIMDGAADLTLQEQAQFSRMLDIVFGALDDKQKKTKKRKGVYEEPSAEKVVDLIMKGCVKEAREIGDLDGKMKQFTATIPKLGAIQSVFVDDEKKTMENARKMMTDIDNIEAAGRFLTLYSSYLRGAMFEELLTHCVTNVDEFLLNLGYAKSSVYRYIGFYKMLHMAPALFITKSFTKEIMAKYFNYIKTWFDTPKNEWSVLKTCAGISVNVTGNLDSVVEEREPTLCDVLVLRLMNPPDSVIVEYSILGDAQPQPHDVLRPDKDFDLVPVGQVIDKFFNAYIRRIVPTDAPLWSDLSAEQKEAHKKEYEQRSLEFYRKVRGDGESRKWFMDNWETEKVLCDASEILRQCSKIKVDELKFRTMVLDFMGDNKFLQILHDYYDNPEKYNTAWLVHRDDDDDDKDKDKDKDGGAPATPPGNRSVGARFLNLFNFDD